MLAGKRLIFVSGKGGVGKTTLAAALAMALSERRRVALVEFGNATFPARFGAPPIATEGGGYDGWTVAPGLTIFNITPRQAFEEYATRELRSHRLYSVILDNRFVRYFLDATPGVNALLCLGKVWWMVTHEAWDCCVVDLPATGHGIGYLEVPRVVTQAIHLGPLRKVGEDLRATLEDPAATTVCLVTHLEELPVTETIAMSDRLTALQIGWGPVIANAVLPSPLPPPLDRIYADQCVAWQDDPHRAPLLAATEFLLRRWTLQEEQRRRLSDAVATPPVEVPLLTEATSATFIGAIADRLRPMV